MHAVSSCSIYCLCCNKIHILCGVKLMQHVGMSKWMSSTSNYYSTVSMGQSSSRQMFPCHHNKNQVPLSHVQGRGYRYNQRQTFKTDLSSLAFKKKKEKKKRKADLFPTIVVLHSSKSSYYPKRHMHCYSLEMLPLKKYI